MQNEVEKSRSIPLLRKIFQRGNNCAAELGRQHEKMGTRAYHGVLAHYVGWKRRAMWVVRALGWEGRWGQSGRIQRRKWAKWSKECLGKEAGTRRVPLNSERGPRAPSNPAEWSSACQSRHFLRQWKLRLRGVSYLSGFDPGDLVSHETHLSNPS